MEYIKMAKDFNFLVYNTPDKDIKVNAVIKDDTIWLTQKSMAELFGVQTPAISKHLKNDFVEAVIKIKQMSNLVTIKSLKTPLFSVHFKELYSPK